MATDWNKLKVVDLKAELKRLGLPQNGLKAELVARLEAQETAASEEDVSQPQDEMSDETQDANGEPQRQQEATEVQEVADSTPIENPTKQAEAEVEAIPAAQDTPESTIIETQAPLAPSSDATPPQPAEVIQDSQKRKRRSLSPAPSAHEATRKRAKQDDSSQEAQVVDSIPENVDEAEAPKAEVLDSTQAPEVDMDDTKDEGSAEYEDQNGHPADIAMDDAQPTIEEPLADKPPSPEQPYTTHATDVERDVEPSIHPATSALYIKNFMRPLRDQMVKEHLLGLATPVGTPIDDSTIVDFYLDTIRTHAFVVFSTISAASRVRTILHNRIWPDETNRKALWVDFIPPERFDEWVDTEQASAGGRGATKRYEVTYLHDDDGTLTVSLEEFDNAASNKQEPRGPAPEPERKLSIPTGPSRPFPGIEGAPTGPRGFQANRGAAMRPNRMPIVEQSGLSTRAFPILSFQPVSDEVARRRLDALAAAKTKHDVKDFGKDFKRYYFENGDLLVDRGPEIFLGIRPPHRERERERQRGRERFPGRGRQGGRPRRNGMPIYHGVPRGGDRFRPDRSSRHDSYNRYSDDRGSRRDGYSRH